MSLVTVSAHFDGEHIRLDEPLCLGANARLLVTVLSTPPDGEQQDWRRISEAGLASAYAPDEEEYPLECVREANPTYRRR